MSETTTYIINVSGNAELKLENISKATQSATGSMRKLRDAIRNLGDSMFALNNINNALQNVRQSMTAAIQPGIAFNSSLTDLSALTNVTGEKLKEIGNYARENAKVFGGSASDGVESFKLLLSQLSPEIAKVPEALDAMGKSVSILSKTMGNDTTAAAEVLSTAMNQYQVSLDDPLAASKKMAEMMNVMAAAAQAGSAEMPQIKAALENSGMAAKTAGVSFEELNAAIQVLDKAGKKGAEGGIAIRNALSILSEGRFMPKKTLDALTEAGVDVNALGDTSKTLTERLRLLQPMMSDQALMTQVFGRENYNAALALISGVDQIDEYTKAITGTNSAQEQANIVMGSFSEKMSRMAAQFDDWKIRLFNIAKGAIPAFNIAASGMQIAVNSLTLFNMLATIGESALGLAIKEKTKKMRESITATWASISASGTFIPVTLGAALAALTFSKALKAIGNAIYGIPIIGWIALGISLIAGLFVTLWNKSQQFREMLFGVLETVKAVFYNIGVVIKTIFSNLAAGFVAQWNEMITVLSNIGGFIYSSVLLPVWNGILAVINGIADFFVTVWNWISGIFGNIAGWLDQYLLTPVKQIFTKLWDFIGKILDKIIDGLSKPIRWIKELWNKIFPKDQFKDINVAYNVGVKKGTESWNKSQKEKETTSATATTTGVNQYLQSVAKNFGGAGGENVNTGGSKAGRVASETIATGGTRNTSIQVTVKSMIENLVMQGGTGENKQEIERNMAEAFYRMLNMVSVSAK